MSKQRNDLTPSQNQKRVLDLEKQYFNIIEEIINSHDFLQDLKHIERETKSNYRLLSKIWDLKNKIKIPCERLVRYHIYKYFFDNGKDCSFFPSPVSCDLAIETDDAILNIDVKTDDISGNSGDIKNTQLEHNQSSFDNKPIGANNEFKGLEAIAHLKPIDQYSGKINLTYLIKIVYYDDGIDFYISNNNEFPTLTLTCIPNGILSELFDFDLLTNFKTYKYYKKTDGEYYEPKLICNKDDFNNLSEEEKFSMIESKIVIPNTWIKGKVVSRIGYYDTQNDTIWLPLKPDKKDDYYLTAVKYGDSSRYKNEYLIERYDSTGNQWLGLKEYYEKLKDIN